MSPDSSQWMKGLQAVVNAVPYDAGAWREVLTSTVVGSVAVPAGSDAVGAFGDDLGRLYFGTTNAAGPSSRLYQMTPPASFTNRTPGTDYAGAPARWRFTQFGAVVIAAPDNSSGSTLRLQSRVSGAGLTFANLVTSVDIPVPRFVTVAHGHVVGAYNQTGGAGVYAAEDPYQFMWSSRNNAAVWTPGTDAAGFAPVNNGFGKITGILGFEDFFLLFQEYGVVRYTWTGGNFVWEEQGIGSRPWGLSSIWSPGLVRIDRDAYYWSTSGPAALRNGEQAEQVGGGAVRRYFTDTLKASPVGPNITLNASFSVQGDYEPESGLILWTGTKQFGTTFQIAYHIASDRFSVLDGGLLASPLVAAIRSSSPERPLGSFAFPAMNGSALVEVRRLIPPSVGATTSQDIAFYTSRWRPETGKRVILTGLRMLLALSSAAGSAVGVNVAVTRHFDPFAAAVDTTSITLAGNESGWTADYPLPLEGAEFSFVVTITGIVGSGSRALLEAPALELAFEPSSGDY